MVRTLYGLLQDMSDIDIDLSYNIHVKQLIRCCRYFIDLIRQSEFGRIIVISSIWVKQVRVWKQFTRQ